MSAANIAVCVGTGPLDVKATVAGRMEERAIAVIFMVEIDAGCVMMKSLCAMHEVVLL